MKVRVEVQGAREIAAAMRELPRRVDRKILNAGLLAGARLVRDEARAIAPVLKNPDPRWRPGTLKKAIQAATIAASRTPYAGEVIVRVRKLTQARIAKLKRSAAKRGRSVNPIDPYYWFWVEFGTAKMKAQPFMRPAFEAQKNRAVDAAMQVFRDKVQLEIQKLGRRF